MVLIAGGFLPRVIVPCPPEIGVVHVREIWSASCHISAGPPDGWIDHWVHNRLEFFDTEKLARSVLTNPQPYQVVAYRLWDELFTQDGRLPLDLSDIRAAAPGPDYEIVGYDAVSTSFGDSFECSPLSCNYAARSFNVNGACLFSTLDEAMRGAETFAAGSWEPGPYRVVEVSRKRPA